MEVQLSHILQTELPTTNYFTHLTIGDISHIINIERSPFIFDIDLYRTESGKCPTEEYLSTLIRLAEGMGMVLHLEFIPKQLR